MPRKNKGDSVKLLKVNKAETNSKWGRVAKKKKMMRSWQGPDSSGFETVSVLYCKDNRKIKNNSKQGNDITLKKKKKKIVLTSMGRMN